MRNYFNKYNVINFTVFIWIVSFILERLSLFLFFQMNLESFYYFVVFIWILRLIIVSAFSILFFIIILDFASRNAEFDYFRNSIKSYVATWQMRRFCRQINVEPSFEESSRYSNSKQEIIRKANRSLLTLTVVYYEQKAVATWTFPANCVKVIILWKNY